MADKQPWDRLDNERNLWFQRFERFRLMGPTRSLSAAANAERVEKGRKESKDPPGSWRRKAKEDHWFERAEAWDQHLSDQAAAEAETERLRILSSGYALRHKRVDELNKLAELLLEELLTEDKRWLPDVKQIGSGEFAERIDIVRFNSALIRQFRETLEDLAAEMGERVRGLEIFGKDGKPLIPVNEVVAALRLADELMAAMGQANEQMDKDGESK